jgi:hypothetical protein
MAKFLRIGVHHSNVSGYTSKAWSVRRVGSTALLKWGAVKVLGVGQDRRIFWVGLPRAYEQELAYAGYALFFILIPIPSWLRTRFAPLKIQNRCESASYAPGAEPASARFERQSPVPGQSTPRSFDREPK